MSKSYSMILPARHWNRSILPERGTGEMCEELLGFGFLQMHA
jgi:hypothetical protein